MKFAFQFPKPVGTAAFALNLFSLGSPKRHELLDRALNLICRCSLCARHVSRAFGTRKSHVQYSLAAQFFRLNLHSE